MTYTAPVFLAAKVATARFTDEILSQATGLHTVVMKGVAQKLFILSETQLCN